ncbi:hypothetical protein ACFL6C_13415 [Myxococcota bacterium]
MGAGPFRCKSCGASFNVPGRYRSSRSYDETLEYYKRLFRRTGGVRWHNIVNLPGIKARNIQSLRKKTDWEGINLYENGGEVRIFVMAREKPPPNRRKRSVNATATNAVAVYALQPPSVHANYARSVGPIV